MAAVVAGCGSSGSSSTGGSETEATKEAEPAKEAETTAAVAPKIKVPPTGKPIGNCEPSGCDLYKNVDWSPLEGNTVGVLATATNRANIRFNTAVKECVEEHGGSIDEVNLNADFTKGPSTLQGMINSGDVAITDLGLEVQGYHSFLQQAKQKGIPIAVWGAGTAPGTVAIGSNEFEDGVLNGEYLVERLPEGGKILTITNQTVPSIRERLEGLEYVLEQHPEFELVEKTGPEFTAEEAEKITSAYLLSEPDLAAVVGGFTEWALGGLNAIERAGSEAIVISANGDPEEYEAMSRPESQYVMTVADGIELGGRLACESIAVMLGGGKPAGEDLIIESKAVTSEDEIPTEGKVNEEPRKVFSISPSERSEG
jgi:ABC-type sugar transport system substrate-binding protein